MGSYSLPRRLAPLLLLSLIATEAPAAGRCGDPAQRPWCDTTLSPRERTDLLLAAMSLSQKVGLMSGDDFVGVINGEPATGTSDGIPELGLPTLYLSDGPSGPREGQATAFPSPLTLGATFNPELAYRVGKTISNEVRNKANDLIHAPTVDIMRTGLAGRTFETQGEDPYLTSQYAVQWVLGAQSEGIIANVKHYLLNSQEGQIGVPPFLALIGPRHLVNPQVSERALREIYMPPFEAAVMEGGAGSVMCSYNLVNNAPACGSYYLLQQVLRDEWGFDGFVVSDYLLAAKDTIGSANNGLELEMPIAQFYQPLLLQAAVTAGLISQETLDRRVGNILRTLFKFGFFDREDFPDDDSLIDRPAHAAVAREVAEQGMVLLQNNGLLPLDPAKFSKLAIIGQQAATYHNVGGSAAVEPYEFRLPHEVIAERAGSGVTTVYLDGSDVDAAVAAARDADVVLLFVGDDAKEGVDKTCLALDCAPIPFLPAFGTPQADLIAAVSAANAHTVVLTEIGGPILTPWRKDVAAVLATWYPGQEAGAAIARVLFGDVDASGRLPVTFPETESQTPTAGNPLQYPGSALLEFYTEDVLIGYRWYDRNQETPAFPFGFGLSYTTFGYDQFSVTPAADGRTARARLRVTNTGSRAGVAVPQLYVGMPAPSGLIQPPKQLKGFERVILTAGESRTVEFELNERAFSYWDEGTGGWKIEPGCYQLMAGASSRDLPLAQSVGMGGGSCAAKTRFGGGALPLGLLLLGVLGAALRLRR